MADTTQEIQPLWQSLQGYMIKDHMINSYHDNHTFCYDAINNANWKSKMYKIAQVSSLQEEHQHYTIYN